MSNSPTSNPKSAENHFFEHFATLATAPDGIARLRELILLFAVQGKLGTQDAGDEPSNVLLARIKKEKEQFEKTGEITVRKTKESNYSNFCVKKLPSKWECRRLEDLSLLITKGATPTSYGFQFLKKGINFIKVENVRNGQIDKKSIQCFISLEAHNSQSRSILQKGDLLFSIAGSIGTSSCFVREEDLPANVNQALAIVRGTTTVFNPQYLLLFLRSNVALDQVLCRSRGGAMNNISLDDIRNILVNIPPLAEQHRIVAKVDRLVALCEELEARQQQERAGCLKLGTASFAGLQNAENLEEFGRLWAQVCDAFDLILDCPENVAVLRQTILQLAVQGRLVRQEPGDDPASILLEAIRKEKDRLIKDGKIQKEKPLKFMNGDDVPFKIPNEWLWTYFGQITFNRDGARIPIEKAERATRHGAYDYYGASGVIDTIDDYLFDKPLLLIGEDGANLVNRSTPIAFIAHGKYWVNNHAHVLDGISFEFLRYLEVYINSIDLRPYLTGMAQPKMNQAKMNSIPVPLPPLAEQHRIVAKVDTLMALCDALEARLKERAGVQGKLANSIVRGDSDQ